MSCYDTVNKLLNIAFYLDSIVLLYYICIVKGNKQ